MRIISIKSKESYGTDNTKREDEISRETPPCVASDERPHVNASECVAASKLRFKAAVSNKLSELMTEGGFSRERAISVMLEEIQIEGGHPSDDEVFKLMNNHGLGLEDATRALVISQAVYRSCKNRNIPPSQAIDELTNKLSMSRVTPKNQKNISLAEHDSRTIIETSQTNESSSKNDVHKSSLPSVPKTTSSTRKISVKSQLKNSKKNAPSPNLSSPKANNVKPKKLRKDELPSQAPICDTTVPLALVKKAKLATDASSDTTKNVKVSKRKRTAQHVSEQVLDTPSKRTRGTTL